MVGVAKMGGALVATGIGLVRDGAGKVAATGVAGMVVPSFLPPPHPTPHYFSPPLPFPTPPPSAVKRERSVKMAVVVMLVTVVMVVRGEVALVGMAVVGSMV